MVLEANSVIRNNLEGGHPLLISIGPDGSHPLEIQINSFSSGEIAPAEILVTTLSASTSKQILSRFCVSVLIHFLFTHVYFVIHALKVIEL